MLWNHSPSSAIRRAVSEYLVERMIQGGADKICFVIGPAKSDILHYFGGRYGEAAIAYVVQPQPGGLCDAIFRATPLIAPDEPVIVGLPDTIWFPADALRALPDDRLSFLLFPVDRSKWYFGSRYSRTTETAADGAFALSGVPGGNYYVVALTSLPDGGDDAWQDPAVLDSLIAGASTVAVADAQPLTVALRVQAR